MSEKEKEHINVDMPGEAEEPRKGKGRHWTESGRKEMSEAFKKYNEETGNFSAAGRKGAGVPRKPAEEKQDRRVTVSLTPRERDAVKELADKRGISLSGLVRRAALEATASAEEIARQLAHAPRWTAPGISTAPSAEEPRSKQLHGMVTEETRKQLRNAAEKVDRKPSALVRLVLLRDASNEAGTMS